MISRYFFSDGLQDEHIFARNLPHRFNSFGKIHYLGGYYNHRTAEPDFKQGTACVMNIRAKVILLDSYSGTNMIVLWLLKRMYYGC